VLANEQAEGGVCWRCQSAVEPRELDQWFLRITAYQDQLLDDMASLGWPDRVLVQQRNWIGRSPGAEVDFPVEGQEPIRVFTTRIDTIFGATFMVLAPEHPRVPGLIAGTAGEEEATLAVKRLRSQDRRARLEGQVEKEGVSTGRYATNPFTGQPVPVWVGNFVLMSYGTGAIMSVPAHDQRDFDFAKKYALPIRVVIQPEGKPLQAAELLAAYAGPGQAADSGEWTGLDSATAIARMVKHAEAHGFGRGIVTYRLKDWLISRQRYWGTPIPVLYCDKDGMQPVPDRALPIVLPKDAPFTGEGGNPLARVPTFVNATCPTCQGPARRETDTMDTFVDSSWYFYRYLSPKKEDGPVDAAAVRYWFPIDLYVGGIEHAILHLVYSRFWTKVMRDLGLVSFDEPVLRLFPQGMVHKDGEVMSKSKGNTVAPDDVIASYGADTLRVYVLGEAPAEMALEWSEERIGGSFRLVQRAWRLVDRHAAALASPPGAQVTADLPGPARDLRRKTHQTIQKVTADIDRIHLNTVVAAFHELVNEILRLEPAVTSGSGLEALREAIETLVLIMSPFAPHVCEEMWLRLGHQGGLVRQAWPVADEAAAREDAVELAVQVNGKVRGRITVPREAGEAEIRRFALAEPRVAEEVNGKQVTKLIVVPGRLVSLVVR
jgi:leucyl-tRNA synthetase